MAVAAAWFASAWAMVAVIGCTRDEAVAANRCAQLRDHVIDTKLKTLANVGLAPAIATTGFDRRASEPLSASEVANHRAAEEQVAANSYATTTYRYDAADNVIEIVDPAGGTTAMTHDFAGRRTQLTRGGRTWTYTYDKNGNQIAERFLVPPQPFSPTSTLRTRPRTTIRTPRSEC